MIDLHAHLLPDLDDGPRRTTDARSMAEAALAAGTTTMACTPHVRGRDPLTPARIAEATADFRRHLDRVGVPLEIVQGAAIGLDALARFDDETLRALSFGGRGAWLLLEMPLRGWPADLGTTLDDLEVRGFRAILARPERADAVQRQPDRLRDAIGRGALLLVTASSFTGDHGQLAERTAERLLAHGWAHLMASDAHSADWRPPGLLPGIAAASSYLGCGAGDLSWMVAQGPEQILAGQDVRPPRLPTRVRR